MSNEENKASLLTKKAVSVWKNQKGGLSTYPKTSGPGGVGARHYWVFG